VEFARSRVVPEITRRLGEAPSERRCSSSTNCPDVFELDSGDFAIIGHDATQSITLPDDAGCSTEERVVVVPRAVLLAAFEDFSRSSGSARI
jgi:hypothetical protein